MEPGFLLERVNGLLQRGYAKMRLDKFLKVSRLIKRRTLAKEAAERGRIIINGTVAKPASDVAIGDILELSLGSRHLTVEVVDLKETVRAADASSLYRMIKEERVTKEPNRMD
jgi:ribosomal 50S subunit-recycling heat shock protein